MAKRAKLLLDKFHKTHRARVRKWRAKHPGKVYKKVGPCWKWVAPKRR